MTNRVLSIGLVERTFENHVGKWTDYLNRDVN